MTRGQRWSVLPMASISHFLFWLLSLVQSLKICLALAARPRRHPPLDTARNRQLHLHRVSKHSVLILDVENIRGQSGFHYSHADLFQAMSLWTSLQQLHGRVILVMDHGEDDNASSFWIDEQGYAVVFAGPHCKADDVIARDTLPYFLTRSTIVPVHPPAISSVVVVTADQGLLRRCQLRARLFSKNFDILPPLKLLEDLDQLRRPVVETVTAALLAEKLGECETLLRSRKGRGLSRRQRVQLQCKVAQLQKAFVADTEQSSVHSDRILSLWSKVHRSFFNKKETTEDRIVLARDLQSDFVKMCTANVVFTDGVLRDNNKDSEPLAQSYVDHHQKQQPGGQDSTFLDKTSVGAAPFEALSSTSLQMARNFAGDLDGREELTREETVAPLRLVVISDTHGWEEQLGEFLPDGDVLLHLGDFSYDERDSPEEKREYFNKLDTWLARQSHEFKIVLRGNHDPRHTDFKKSRALFVTKPTTLDIKNSTFVLLPYSRGVLSSKYLPRACNVVASHEPAKGLLDRVVNTERNAGSYSLRRRVEGMKGGPPALLLCGHIHEGRGALRHVFCGEVETLVVNAACANSGRAQHVEHGPVVVDVTQCHNKRLKEAALIQMPGRYTYLNNRVPSFFQEQSNVGTLLAVDLGLRTGLSLYSATGQLLRFADFHFDSAEELCEGACRIVAEWEREAALSLPQSLVTVTHVAVEGADRLLRQAWSKAMQKLAVLVLYVKPDEWREDLLLTSEKKTGLSAKAASRQIAKQIVADYGSTILTQSNYNDDIQTDAAESILLGLYVARRLGWIEREPAIRRAKNGSVVLSLDKHQFSRFNPLSRKT